MQPRTQAVRVISSLYAQEVIKSLRTTMVIVVGVLMAIVVGLTVVINAWWLLFLVPLFLILIATFMVYLIASSIAKAVAPTMTQEQYTAAKAYVASMHEVTGNLQTSQFMIAIKILIDVFKRRWKDGYIMQTITGSARLKKDFSELSALFAAN